MKSIGTTALCQGLRLSRTRLDQWISRGVVVPSQTPPAGSAREWTMADAMKVAIIADLADVGTLLAAGADETEFSLAMAIQGLRPHLFQDEDAYLVLARFKGKIGDEKVRENSPHFFGRILPWSSVAAHLKDRTHGAVLLFNLNDIERRLLEFWPKEAT